MGVVDFHSHYFSRTFFETLAQLSPREGSVEAKLEAVAGRTGLEIPDGDGDAHLARWLGELDAGDVEHLVTFASVPPEAEVVADAARRSGGRITGMVMVDPNDEGQVRRASGMLRARSVRGALVFPAMHRFEVAGDEMRGLLAALEAARGVLYVHCGLLVVKLRDLLGLPRAYDLRFANPLAIVPAADAFPGVRFVIPHFGAGFFREALIAGAQCANVYVDSSSSNAWVRTNGLELREVFARALDVFGPERVLFGTDSGTFPAGWRRDRLEEQRGVLEGLGASESDAARVFGGNARELLGE